MTTVLVLFVQLFSGGERDKLSKRYSVCAARAAGPITTCLPLSPEISMTTSFVETRDGMSDDFPSNTHFHSRPSPQHSA